MRRELPGGFEVDDDPARIDLDAVYEFLSNESYWARGRPRETVERLVRQADRVAGLYADGRQIGFARAFTDGVAAVYLADVYVLPEFRGRGLGVELIREMVERSSWPRLKWLLHTRDAHELYRRVGFGAPSERAMERQ